jgi:hypothetical protein
MFVDGLYETADLVTIEAGRAGGRGVTWLPIARLSARAQDTACASVSFRQRWMNRAGPKAAGPQVSLVFERPGGVSRQLPPGRRARWRANHAPAALSPAFPGATSCRDHPL